MSNFFERFAFCYNIIPILLRIDYPLVEKEIDLRKGERVLDVGGGTGRLAKKIVDLFDVELTILDTSASMLKRVRKHPRIRIIRGSIENSYFQNNSFDVILCVDTLHHLGNPERALKEMYRVLTPQGKIFIQDFDITKYRIKILKFVESYLLKEPGKFYSPQSLAKELEKIGFNGFIKFIRKIQYLYIGKKS